MGVSQQLVLLFALGSMTRGAAVATGPKHLPSFASFTQRYGRTYNTDAKEYELRRTIYDQRVQQVHHHNSQPQRLWSAAINHLSDRTEDELSQLRGLRAMQSSRKKAPGMIGVHTRNGQFLSQVRSSVLPDEKSWAHLNAVKQDVDQGACGSCWAIATSMMLQANAEIYGLNRTFSAQELVDCVPNPHNCGGSGGCSGATVELGMNWITQQGLDTDAGTPYKGSDASCKKQASSLVALNGDRNDHLEDMVAVGFHPAPNPATKELHLQGWERLPENEYQPLIQAVAERGPVAVSVGAGGWALYGNGVFNNCDKDSEIDHAVTLIGYGIDKQVNQKYWLIKNSWGNSFGENGNIRLLREEGNVHCGTDNQPKVGTGCDGGPSSVHVCGMCGILYDAVVPHFKKA